MFAIKPLAIFVFLLTSTFVTQAQIDLKELVKTPEGIFEYNGVPYSGKVFSKYENGTVGTFGELKNGKREGLWTWWYSDGKKKRESTYINNKKEGLTYYWYKNGVVAKEIMYRNDKNIDQILRDENGKIRDIIWEH